MDEKNFPVVQAKSPSESLKMLGVDEGAILEYTPSSGMYVVSADGDQPYEDEFSSFAKTVGFSKGIIDILLEVGVVEELLIAEDLGETEGEKIDEVIEYDKADLTMLCGRCGTEEKVTEATGGVTLVMPTTSQAETRLVCSKCGNRMSFIYRNGSMFTEEERTEFELARKIQAAEQNKARAEQDLEILSNMKEIEKDEGNDKEISDESQKESE